MKEVNKMIFDKEQHELIKEIVKRIRLEIVSEQKDEKELLIKRIFKIQDEPLILLVYQYIEEKHDWFIIRVEE